MPKHHTFPWMRLNWLNRKPWMNTSFVRFSCWGGDFWNSSLQFFKNKFKTPKSIGKIEYSYESLSFHAKTKFQLFSQISAYLEMKTPIFYITIFFVHSRNSKPLTKMEWILRKSSLQMAHSRQSYSEWGVCVGYQKSNFRNESCCSFHVYPWATLTQTH